MIQLINHTLSLMITAIFVYLQLREVIEIVRQNSQKQNQGFSVSIKKLHDRNIGPKFYAIRSFFMLLLLAVVVAVVVVVVEVVVVIVKVVVVVVIIVVAILFVVVIVVVMFMVMVVVLLLLFVCCCCLLLLMMLLLFLSLVLDTARQQGLSSS